MGAQEIRSRRQRSHLEPPNAIGGRNRGRDAERGNRCAGDRETFFVLNDALNGAGSKRREVRHCLNLRTTLRARARCDTQERQNAERPDCDHSGTPCHVCSRGPWPAAPARTYDGLTVNGTSRTSVLLAILSVTLISSRYCPSGNDASGTACPLCSW